MSEPTFGDCCDDLGQAMTRPPHSMFSVDETSRVLFLTVGYAMTEDGPGWFDMAAMFCPFCGKALQSKDEIRRRQTP